LCLTEAQIDDMSWEHYLALRRHWKDSPPAQVVLAAWLKANARR
jgi:hypothetical protein